MSVKKDFSQYQRMTRKQAAAYIGVSEGTLSVWACTGKVKIPFYKAGASRVFYLKHELDEFLQSTRRYQS
ncbi:TPA: helix-turn-helix domain-containing protein [Escherichia coli]|nr:helix-turn-helix domain-containing protein [Escherichia coli O146]